MKAEHGRPHQPPQDDLSDVMVSDGDGPRHGPSSTGTFGTLGTAGSVGTLGGTFGTAGTMGTCGTLGGSRKPKPNPHKK